MLLVWVLPGKLGSCKTRATAVALAAAWLLGGEASITLPGAPAVDGSATPSARRTQDQNLPDVLQAKYLRIPYAFSKGYPCAYRECFHQGRGDMILWRKDGRTYFRQQAEARSPVLGNIQITMLADSKVRKLYFTLNVESLHEQQCLWYPFPRIADFPNRVRLIRERLSEFSQWPGRQPLSMKWTKSNMLDLIGNRSSFSGINFKRGDRIVKSLSLTSSLEQGDQLPADVQDFFKPASSCRKALDTQETVGGVELVPPHHRSSVLNDLLLLLGLDSIPEDFIALSAMALPGDTAILGADPEPPNMEKLADVSFDYNATVYRPNRKDMSFGTFRINLGNRAFRLNGVADHTVLGKVDLDFIATQTPKPAIYANVALVAELKRECMTYDYPDTKTAGSHLMGEKPAKSLKFMSVDEIDDEDCAIFAAPLTRGRYLYLWVDQEDESLQAILRAEVRHGKRLLRRVDIWNWRQEEDISPATTQGIVGSWNCHNASTDGQGQSGVIAHLGVANAHKVHRRSLELLESLYAVRHWDPAVALLDLFALPGDVSLLIAEPELPEMWTLPSLTFDYSLSMPYVPAKPLAGQWPFFEKDGQWPLDGERDSPLPRSAETLGGSFAADFRHDKVFLTAGALGTETLRVAISPESIDVQILTAEDSGKCPDTGLRSSGRCWYVSDEGQSCNTECAKHGLAFAWKVAPDGEPMMPSLLGHQPRLKQQPWGRLECYVKDEDRYHPAQAIADADTKDEGDPGEWSYYSCNLACPCSPMVQSKDADCLILSMPFNKSTHFDIPDTLWSFDTVEAIDDVECNKFTFPVQSVEPQRGRFGEGQGELNALEAKKTLETSVEFWYSQEDNAAHRLRLERGHNTISTINITSWRAPDKPPPVTALQTSEKWNCRSRETAYKSWLQLADSRQHARLVWDHCKPSDCPVPASAAIWELAEAAGVVGLIPPAAQEKLTRLLAWPVKPQDEPHVRQGPLVDMFSENLQAFSFSFSSVLVKGTARSHGVGEVRVDLKRRRLSMRSEAHNVSRGVPLVESHIIYLGDRPEPLLLLHSQIPVFYEQCWSVKGRKSSQQPGQGKQPNPFARATHIGSGFSAPTEQNGRQTTVHADKYRLTMDVFKQVDLFLEEAGQAGSKKLIAMNLQNQKQQSTTAVTISGWATDPIDEKWFEQGASWNCDDTRYPPNLQSKLDEWDLLNFFFPQEQNVPASETLSLLDTTTPTPNGQAAGRRVAEDKLREDLQDV